MTVFAYSGNDIISYIAFFSNSGVVSYLCAFQTLSMHSLNLMAAIYQKWLLLAGVLESVCNQLWEVA